MIYPNLSFPKLPNRPYFFTNFVETVDGKVAVGPHPNPLPQGEGNKEKLQPHPSPLGEGGRRPDEGYWPIGSETDKKTLRELRMHCDVLLHGKTTAMHHRNLDFLGSDEFQKGRVALGKKSSIIYAVLTTHPDEALIDILKNPPAGTRPMLVTTVKSDLPTSLTVIPSLARDLNIDRSLAELEMTKYKVEITNEGIEVLRCGKDEIDLIELSKILKEMGCDVGLMEGGPHTIGEFLAADLIDEVFVTIAPKIFGNNNGRALTMVEGTLLPPDKINHLELISALPHNNEIYLHYKVQH